MSRKRQGESDVSVDVRSALDTRGKFWKIHTTGIPDPKAKGGFRTNPNKGFPDLVGIYRTACPGCGIPFARFAAAEVKRPGIDGRPDQLRFLALVRTCGGLGIVARSGVEALASFDRQVERDRQLPEPVRIRTQTRQLVAELLDRFRALGADPESEARAMTLVDRLLTLHGIEAIRPLPSGGGS